MRKPDNDQVTRARQQIGRHISLSTGSAFAPPAEKFFQNDQCRTDGDKGVG